MFRSLTRLELFVISTPPTYMFNMSESFTADRLVARGVLYTVARPDGGDTYYPTLKGKVMVLLSAWCNR